MVPFESSKHQRKLVVFCIVMRIILFALLAVLYILFGLFVFPVSVHIAIPFGSLIWLCLLPRPDYENEAAPDHVTYGVIRAVPAMILAVVFVVSCVFALLAMVQV